MEKEELKAEIKHQESLLSDAEFKRSTTSYGSRIAMIAVGGGLTLIFGIYSLVMLVGMISIYSMGASDATTSFIIFFAVFLPLLGLGIALLCFGINGLHKRKELRYQCDIEIMHAKEKLRELREEERKL